MSTEHLSTPPSPPLVHAFCRRILTIQNFAEAAALIMENPSWLEPAWVSCAESYANSLGSMLRLTEGLHHFNVLVKALAAARGVRSFEKLANGAKRHPLLVSEDLLGLSSSLDQVTRDPQYELFRKAREEWPARWEQILKSEHIVNLIKTDPEMAKGFRDGHPIDIAVAHQQFLPLAIDSASISYLAALVSFQINTGSHAQVSRLTQILEGIETIGFNAQQLKYDGSPRAFRRSNSGQAAVWYIECSDLPRWLPLIEAIGSKKLAFADALSQAVASAWHANDAQMQQDGATENPLAQVAGYSREYQQTVWSAAFAVLAAQLGTVEQTNKSLAALKALLVGPWWRSLHPCERASTVFRYCQFVLFRFSSISEQHDELKTASDLLTLHLKEPIFEEHPGLKRDMHLSLARLLAEMTRWHPELRDSSIREFQKGLSVPWAQYDCEARGQGLSDLAGAMWRTNKQPDLDLEIYVETFYRRSLAYLPKDRFVHARATVLVNYAMFLNERMWGEDSRNQEFALRAIDEALEIERDAPIDYKSPAAPHFRELKATIWLTRGNIIRTRTFGINPSPQAELLTNLDVLPKGLDATTAAAISNYQSGLADIDSQQAVSCGLLHLNAGLAYLENRPRPCLQLASRHFRMANEFLGSLPRECAATQVGEIWCQILSGEIFSRIDMDTNLEILSRCVSTFQKFHDWPRAYSASILCIKILSFESKNLYSEKAFVHANTAVDFALKTKSTDTLINALRVKARVLVEWSKISKTESHELQLRDNARKTLAEALESARSRLAANLPLSEKILLHEQASAISADLVWVTNGSDTDILSVLSEVIEASNDTGLFLADSYDDFRRTALQAEDVVWSGSASSNVDEHIAQDVELLEVALHEFQRAREIRYLAAPPEEVPATTGAVGRNISDTSLIVQFVISEWGSIALIHEKNSPVQSVQLQITRSKIREWLNGTDSEPGWLDSYHRRSTNLGGGTAWEAHCERLLTQISEGIWAPLSEAGIVFDSRDLLVVPGHLAALPLHAASLGEQLVIDVVSGFAYLPIPNFRACSCPKSYSRALLVLSDPVTPGGTPLAFAPREISSLSAMCVAKGLNIDLLLNSWGISDGAAFKALPLPESVKIDGQPSPENVQMAMQDVDLIVYSGHGRGIGSFGGCLILSDASGRPVDFSLLKALASAPLARHPGVVLSACETAWDLSGPGLGLTSIASTFLRLGSSFVLGSLWRISDLHAPIASSIFMKSVLNIDTPEHAFVAMLRHMSKNGVHVARWGAYCLWLGQGPRSL